MKKVICIFLTLSLMLSVVTPVFAEESEESQYGALKVEYSDALGNIERLDVMVKDDHVYADAVALSNRLGYECTQEGNLVSIFAKNNFFHPSAPLLAVHFSVNENKVAYNPLFGVEYEYTTPAPCIVDENGTWVPLTYTLVLLGGNSTILEDTLLIQMPQNNVLSIAATIVNNEDALSFDWVSHFGYSEITTNVTDGAGRIVTLFSGLLEFDGDAWLSLIDWSAFDKKFGKSLATMFCTNSTEELEESIEQVELLLDVFSPDGKSGEMLRNKQIRIDSDVAAWKTACDEYLELLEQGSGSPTKYNLLYQQYERAVDDQSLFAALGGDDAIYIQNELSSAANVLDVASKVGSAVSYFKEFQQKDDYQISVLKSYLTTRTPTDNMPNATADAMMKYLSSTDRAGQYVFSRFLEENALELIVDKSGFDAYLGLPANILLLAWDIMSGTIPFYSEGLKAVENREISNYAQKVQNDALTNLKYLIAELKQAPTISAEDCVQLSEYCYVYLKACYIARTSAIKSLDNTSEEFRKEIKGKFDVEADINQFAVEYLSLLSSADTENSCYILGFLPENNVEYLNNYSDDVVLNKVDWSREEKRLMRVNQTDADGNVSTTTFVYNDKGLLISTTHTSEYDTSTYTYVYDEVNRLIEVWSSFWGDHGPKIKYHYDANGYLVEISGIGEGGGVGGVYENDDLGRPVSYTTGGDFYSSVTEYTYSDDGRTISTVESSTDYYGDVSVEYVTYTYTYDAEGRILSENRVGSDYSYLHIYSYDHKPFVAEAEEGMLPYHYSINDINGHEIWSLHTGIPETVETDDDGYITRIVYIDHDPTVINGRTYRNDATYEFFYDDKAYNEQMRPQEPDTPQNSMDRIIITEEEAYQIACDYWNYSEGDVSSETGFEMYVVPEYGEALKEDAKTGKYYYCFLLRWLVVDENGDSWMSTCDIIHVDAETGECTYFS